MEEMQRLMVPVMNINPSFLALQPDTQVSGDGNMGTIGLVTSNLNTTTIISASSDSGELARSKLNSQKRVAVSPPEVSQSPKRQCISMACMLCRERRLKCNGEKPCGACKEANNAQSACRYDPTQDFRRKAAMRNRIVELEKSERDYKAIIDLLRRPGDGCYQVVTSIRNLDDATEPHLIFDHVVREVILQEDTRLSQPLLTEPGQPQSHAKPKSVSPKAPNGISTFSHYGFTSRLPWEADEGDIPSSSAPAASEWTAVTSDNEFVTEILDLYFTWSHPAHLLFSEETFYHGMRARKLKYCTPLLMNAILAIGCTFSLRAEARKIQDDSKTAGDHFFDEAHRLWANEQGVFLTTVQALGLMSLRATMRHDNTMSRLYLRHMIEMVNKLQMNSLPGEELPRNISEAEGHARRITICGCHCLETSSALFDRRVSALSASPIEVNKLVILPELENTLWKPYGTLFYDGGESEMAQPSNKYSILFQNSLLAAIVEEITTLLFGSDDRVEDDQLAVLYEKLQKWFRDLPAELDVQNHPVPLPQLISLHSYYHYCIIQLFRRPLMLSFLQHDTPTPQPCIDAATRISQLMQTYVTLYGTDKCFSTLPRCFTSAAIVHVLSLDNSLFSSSKQRKISAELYLAQAIRTLHEMKANHCLKVVLDLIDTWEVTVPATVRIPVNQIRRESISGTMLVSNPADGITNDEVWALNNAQDNGDMATDDVQNVAWDQSWTNF